MTGFGLNVVKAFEQVQEVAVPRDRTYLQAEKPDEAGIEEDQCACTLSVNERICPCRQ